MKSLNEELFEGHVRASEPDRKVRSRQSQLGQFFTPESISAFMAGMFADLPREVRLLDPGAGSGALTAAFIAHAKRIGFNGSIDAVAVEKDEVIIEDLRSTLAACANGKVTARVLTEDFVERAATMIKLGTGDRYNAVIANPPYMKIGVGSAARQHIRAAGLETVNMYSGFVGLALELLEVGGDLVAITPRSFCNGPYYQPFRRFIFKRAAIQHIHLFQSRKKAFQSDGVLQENIIIHLKRGADQREVKVSTSSDGSFSDYEEACFAFDKIVYPDDPEQFIHIPTGGNSNILTSRAFAHKLQDLGLSVSTGPVVDFRMRDDMCGPNDAGAAPLLYPGHFVDDELVWPKENFKKSNAIRRHANTEKWFYPSGFYSVIRRFSSKEERRRIVANLVDPARLPPCEVIGFENHLNVIHQGKRPLPEDVARGITVFLNSTEVDRYFRRFNGHTQVNATDLRTIRFPSLSAIKRLGARSKLVSRITQEEIDSMINGLS